MAKLKQLQKLQLLFVEAKLKKGWQHIVQHQDPPRICFYIFSRLVPAVHLVGDPPSFVARPAGMWGALDLDHALEAATRQYPEGEFVLLRLDFVLPDPSP